MLQAQHDPQRHPYRPKNDCGKPAGRRNSARHGFGLYLVKGGYWPSSVRSAYLGSGYHLKLVLTPIKEDSKYIYFMWVAYEVKTNPIKLGFEVSVELEKGVVRIPLTLKTTDT